MKTLEEIGRAFGTDKLEHSYLSRYAERFDPLRAGPITICEIGTWQGASVKTWREYFFNPLAKVVGFDHAPEWMPRPEDEITVEIGSQENAAFQQDFGKRHGKFDIIIDDGGHKPQQHLASLKALWPFLKPGGWYCIEDVQSIYDICWNESGCEKTIFDWLTERWKEIVIGGSDVQEVTVVGGNWNDGLVFLRKRWQPYTPRS
jgi:cephalosporin hydroxylase